MNNPFPEEAVHVLYTNYRGEQAWRHIRPVSIWFGEAEWHPGEQWLLDVVDLDKDAERTFAMRDIQQWGRPADIDQGTEQAAADAYTRMVNTPPSAQACAAIKKRLESGDPPPRTVRMREEPVD